MKPATGFSRILDIMVIIIFIKNLLFAIRADS